MTQRAAPAPRERDTARHRRRRQSPRARPPRHPRPIALIATLWGGALLRACIAEETAGFVFNPRCRSCPSSRVSAPTQCRVHLWCAARNLSGRVFKGVHRRSSTWKARWLHKAAQQSAMGGPWVPLGCASAALPPHDVHAHSRQSVAALSIRKLDSKRGHPPRPESTREHPLWTHTWSRSLMGVDAVQEVYEGTLVRCGAMCGPGTGAPRHGPGRP